MLAYTETANQLATVRIVCQLAQAGASLTTETSTPVANVAREFIFVPEAGVSSFAFNIAGAGHVQTSFLTCRSLKKHF